jgi:rare lipoprotein A
MKRVKRFFAGPSLAAIYSICCQYAAAAECGIASTYSTGSVTANGERYNHMAISAAHKTLPFGTRVVVRDLSNGRSIAVRINDRGPYIAGRIIDLSTGAKNALGMDGLAPVCVEVVSYGGHNGGLQNALLRLSPRLAGDMRHARAIQPAVLRRRVRYAATAQRRNARHNSANLRQSVRYGGHHTVRLLAASRRARELRT